MKETADATVFKDHVLRKLEEAAYWHALDGDLALSPEEEATVVTSCAVRSDGLVCRVGFSSAIAFECYSKAPDASFRRPNLRG